MINKNPFKYKGCLCAKKDFNIYIERTKLIKQVLNGIQDMKYFLVIAPGQTGKTTFMWELKDKINEDKFHTHEGIYIPLEDCIKIERNKFYSHIAWKIIHWLRNKYIIDSPELIHMPEMIKDNLDLEDFLKILAEVKLRYKTSSDGSNFKKEKNYKYVIFIDENDWEPRDLADEFFKTLRAIFSQRSNIKSFAAYSFVISGAIDIAKLTDGEISPFNIAFRIDLEDFEEKETKDMVADVLYGIGVSYYPSFPDEIYKATNGHPYFTQKLCNNIVDNLILDNRKYIQAEDLSKHIDNLINNMDIALNTAWQKVEYDKNINILRRIYQGERLRYNEGDDFSYNLKLAGAIVRDESGFCKIRNMIYMIYHKFFNKQFEIYSKKVN